MFRSVIEVGKLAPCLAAIDGAGEGHADAVSGLMITADDRLFRRLWGH